MASSSCAVIKDPLSGQVYCGNKKKSANNKFTVEPDTVILLYPCSDFVLITVKQIEVSECQSLVQRPHRNELHFIQCDFSFFFFPFCFSRGQQHKSFVWARFDFREPPTWEIGVCLQKLLCYIEKPLSTTNSKGKKKEQWDKISYRYSFLPPLNAG